MEWKAIESRAARAVGRALGAVPKPAAPKVRLQTVEPQNAERTGIAIDCSRRLGLACWAVVKFRGEKTLGTVTGHFSLTELAERQHLKRADAIQHALETELQRAVAVAVIDLGVGADFPVHHPARTDDGFGVYDALARLGIPVSSAAAPSAARLEVGTALNREGIDHVGQIKVSTDASFRRGEPTGHGWYVESANMVRPLLGNTTSGLATILEAELYSIRKALKFVRNEFGKEAMRVNGVVVRSDSATAVRMLKDPTWRPQGITKREAVLVKAIHDQDAGNNIRFVWVRGHNGDLGNEIADRLAVAARRLRTARAPRESAAAIMTNIYNEATERYQIARHGLAA